MIKEQNIKVRLYNNNIKYYTNKGYKCVLNDTIRIDIKDIMPQSTINITAICDVCGNEKLIQYRKYINNFKNKSFYVCSSKCAQKKIKLTRKERYNDENFSNIEKREKTSLERYGDKNFKNLEKTKKTNIEKYGFEFSIQNNSIKEKRKSTFIDNYGFDSPIKNNDIKEKRKNTLLEKYGNINYNNISKTLETIKEKNINNIKNKFNLNAIDYIDGFFIIQCKKGHTFKTSYDLLYKRHKYNVEICTVCNPINSAVSDSERKLLEFIQNNYTGEIIANSRKIISPHEIDIYLPKLKLAIEYNGIYWHSELYKDKKYHRDKYKQCEKKGIQLVQIIEDDWIYRNDIVKSMIINKLNKIDDKIYARKCQIKEVKDNSLIRDFLNKNHIQGFVGSKIKIGLFHDNKLVSLMTFKYISDNNYELNRFCNIINTNVVGGASKLFNFFVNNYDFNNIISFSNNLYSNGNLYEKLNFIKIKELKEDYSYIINNIRYHKFNFRNFKNKNLTEKENMLNDNIFRFYDAGKNKYIYSKITCP
jgi:very-short-patch-repair endonuclease